jgi:beta-lactamase regulating signal transducer with metallopeptidase domain
MILLCSGLILIAIAVVIRGTPSMVSSHNALKPLWVAGATICAVAFAGILVSIFLQMFTNKRRESSDSEAQKLKAKLNEQNKKYHDSRKQMISPEKNKKVD